MTVIFQLILFDIALLMILFIVIASSFLTFVTTSQCQHFFLIEASDRMSSESTLSNRNCKNAESGMQGWQRAERAEHEVFPLLVYEQKGILLAHETSRAEQRPHPARSYGERVARSARLVGYMSSLELYVNEYFALESMN